MLFRSAWGSDRTSRKGAECCPFFTAKPKQDPGATTAHARQVSAHTHRSPFSHLITCLPYLRRPGRLGPGCRGKLRAHLHASPEGRCESSLKVQLCSRKCGFSRAPFQAGPDSQATRTRETQPTLAPASPGQDTANSAGVILTDMHIDRDGTGSLSTSPGSVSASCKIRCQV